MVTTEVSTDWQVMSRDVLMFYVNGKKIVEESPDPETTLLSYLRVKLRLTGSKLGCGEGGCGACTVMISKWDPINNKIVHFSANACLALVVSVHGCAVTTVEGIGSTKTKLHAVQERLAKFHGSQCGFCTPGIVMSMYALLRNKPVPSVEDIEECLQGNLCRCTGYRPILSAFNTFIDSTAGCPMGAKCCKNKPIQNGFPETSDKNLMRNDDPHASQLVCFSKYDPTQEILFPPDLLIESKSEDPKTLKFVGERVTWFRPTSLQQLVELKSIYPDAQLVNGNTEIGVEANVRGRHFKYIITPLDVKELKTISVDDKGVNIGSSCTISQIKEELQNFIDSGSFTKYQTQCLESLVEMIYWFAGDQIRNVAAIGGNIMTASPISDLNPILMANESIATFRLHSRAKDRQVLMDQSFFPKYRTTCAEKGEVLISVFLPFNTKDQYMKAYKQSKRREDDIAIVNSAMRVVFHPGTCKVLKFVAAFGGMAATSVMPEKTMQNMIGKEWNETLMKDVMIWLRKDLPLALDAPGGMVEYREALAASFFFKFFLCVRGNLVEKGLTTLEDDLKLQNLTTFKPTDAIHIPMSTRTWQDTTDGQPHDDMVGRPMQHASGDKHTTGEAVYVDDMPTFSDELYLCLVTSIRPHAYIKNVDISKAVACEGFVTYVDHRDVPGTNEIPIAGELCEVFATSKVTCFGQVIGAVVADTQAHAQRAAQLVKIDYEDISPVIITIEDAMHHQSYFDISKNVVHGDAITAMATCDHVIEGEVRIGGQEHFYLETQACIAVPKGEDGEIEMFCSSQDPSMLQRTTATLLGVEANKVVSRVKRMGGGFGGKETRFLVVSNPVAVAAHKCGKAVRCMLSRKEDMIITGGRQPFFANYKVGFMKDGKLVALILDLYGNGGNTLDLSGGVLGKAVIHSDNCYKIPNVLIHGKICKTNISSSNAFRGFGAPQGMLIVESWMTRIAQFLNMTQEKFRDLNMYKEEDVTHFNQKLESFQARRCWEEVIEKSNMVQRKEQIAQFNQQSRWRKKGIACVPTKYAIGFPYNWCHGGALVHVYTDGSVYLSHGGTEMGQGLHTKMLQVAGRCLGIPLSRIHICETSTVTVPNTRATAASFSTDLNGMAVKDACDTIMERLDPLRKQNPDLEWNDLITKAYNERICLSTTGYHKTPGMFSAWDAETGIVEGRTACYFSYGAAVSEVEVDCLTGDHVVLQTDIVMDVGRSLNPAIDIGQIEGAFVQGYGLFTMEEPLHTPGGHVITSGPGVYKIPGFGDCPRNFNVHLLRNAENDRAIYSSKAIGEPPLFLASSVFFAIKDAIGFAREESGLLGWFQLDSPATSELIRMACGDCFTKQHEQHTDPKVEKGVKSWSIRA
uniref:Xanthine dehydrogenase/oxidase n=1 Tax=Phallusia mammillata TaxID=59560 RepID=A0A6F9DWF9_9ASCI|nr:xanthine dehydrogenase/oxidase-like [Phallusia mammillata]